MSKRACPANEGATQSADESSDEEPPLRRIAEPVIIDDVGPPQQDDVEKMESFLKFVNEEAKWKRRWGGNDVPQDGFPPGDPKQVLHKLALNSGMNVQRIMSPRQARRVRDMIQGKYGF